MVNFEADRQCGHEPLTWAFREQLPFSLPQPPGFAVLITVLLTIIPRFFHMKASFICILRLFVFVLRVSGFFWPSSNLIRKSVQSTNQSIDIRENVAPTSLKCT